MALDKSPKARGARYAIYLFFILSLSFSALNYAQTEPFTFNFGAAPIVAAGQVERVFSPVAAEIAQALGQTVLLRTKPTFPLYREELQKEVYDFAIVQPFDYVFASDKHNYLPLVRYEKPLFTSFVVLQNSDLKDFTQLKGKRLAFPPTTAAVTYMGKKALIDANFNLTQDVDLKYTKSHDACLQLVLVGSADTCATSARAAHMFESKWGKHFRVLADTPSIPNSVFVVHRRVPENFRKKLIELLTSWPGDSAVGKTFYEDSNNMRLVPATDSEYDVVRQFPTNLEE